MKYKGWFLALTAILALAPLLMTVALYPSLPDEIIMNWGVDGSVAYRGKAQLFIMSALPLIIAPIMLISPMIDPKRKSYQSFSSAYQGFVLIILLFLAEMTAIIIIEALFPQRISIYRVTMISLGLLFIFFGSICPSVKTNFRIGFKNPWTISDSDIWAKTNRLGGYMFFASGAVICLAPFFLAERIGYITLLTTISLSCVVPTVMSCVWYKAKNN